MRRRSDRWWALAGAVGYAGLGFAFADDPGVRERRLFRRLNRASGLMAGLRVPQQLGTPWTLPLLSLVGFATHRPHLGVSAALALPLEKGLEVGLKVVVQRRRPAPVLYDAKLREDAPAEGPSYPSGHAAIAYTVVLLTVPYVPRAVTAVGTVTATAAAITRVHQAAHWPTDAVGGALLGVTVASTLRAVFGLPR